MIPILGSGNGGSFHFMVPQVTTSKARVKMAGIIGMTKAGIGSVVPVIGSDESNADFRIGIVFDVPIMPIEPIDPDDPAPLPPEPEEVTPVTIDLKIGEMTYQVNGVDHEMDVAPKIIEGRTVLPVRYIADPLGADVSWVVEERKAIVSRGPVYLELWIGNPMVANKGMPLPIDSDNDDVTPIIVPPGRTMLPLRFIAERLGCLVNYDRMDQSIEVVYPIPDIK